MASVGPLALLVLTWRLPAVVNRDFLIVNCFTAFVLEEIGFIQGGYVIGAVSGEGRPRYLQTGQASVFRRRIHMYLYSLQN